MRFSEHLIANGIGIRRFNEAGLGNQGRAFEERTEQNTAAADKNRRVGSQIHLQFAQLVQDVICVLFGRAGDGLNNVGRKNSLSATKHVADMLIIDGHIMESIYLTDDLVVHRDDTGLQTTAILKIELAVLQKKDIGGIAADVHDKDTRRIHNQRTLRNYRSICLREDHNSFNYNTVRPLFIDKFDYAVSLEVLGEFILQYSIVLRGSPTAS